MYDFPLIFPFPSAPVVIDVLYCRICTGNLPLVEKLDTFVVNGRLGCANHEADFVVVVAPLSERNPICRCGFWDHCSRIGHRIVRPRGLLHDMFDPRHCDFREYTRRRGVAYPAPSPQLTNSSAGTRRACLFCSPCPPVQDRPRGFAPARLVKLR